MGLRWNGDSVKRKMQTASMIGINRTMAQATEYSKFNHPWENDSTTLEKGIRIARAAAILGSRISGLWGVVNVVYGKYLERNPKWRWLAPAARTIYPRLATNIKAAFNG